jgi:PAS domain S-box-containing protein
MGTFESDLATGMTYLPKETRVLLGIPPEAPPFTREQASRHIHPDDRPLVANAIAQSIQTGEPYLVEFRVLLPEGGTRWLAARGQVELNERGERQRLVGVLWDITWRKEAEEQLRQSEEGFRILAEAMPQFVWMSDAEGRVEYVNRRWTEYTGQTIEQTGPHGDDVIHPEDASIMWERWNEAKQTGADYEVEFRCRHASNGEYRWFLARGVPVTDRQGHIVRWIGTSTDIHALKEAEEQIGELNARLHRAVYESSHRIKNQLQVLSATADMVLLDGQDMVPAEELRRLRSQIAAIAATHDILTLETRADGTADHISLKSLLERTLAALQQTTDRHSVRFILDDALLPTKAATSIALLLNEMVSNGFKHGGGGVEVTLVITDGQGQLEVCDDGPGFPAGFDARRAANTGLELLLTLTHTDLGGVVEFTNRAGGGARVVVTFPLPVAS